MILYRTVSGDDDNLKKVAEGFSREFLICKEQIETQLNILL
jgi:ribosomal protein L9